MVPWTYVISDLKDEEIAGAFYEKNFKIQMKQEFRVEKAINRKGDKLYFKWKGYNNSCNIWIDKKEIAI